MVNKKVSKAEMKEPAGNSNSNVENKIDFAGLEKKWQDRWAKDKIFEVNEDSKKKKCYVLEMYPYPSASFLHMGHVRNFTIGDIFARYKRMSGFNVLYPMGFDSFGLPAENAAKKQGIHPEEYTNHAIEKIMEYFRALGNSYDWTRTLASHDPDYYRWNQYFFLKLYEKGLAYRKKAPVNWCEKCQSVLANEEAESGKCWRCGEDVLQKEMEQWFLKITAYADRLLEDLTKIDWHEKIKKMQADWIGKSEGVNIFFPIENSKQVLSAFTTRCDTIFSVTFLAIAPESPLVQELIKGTKYEKSVKDFIKKVLKEKVEDRVNEEKEKEGVFIGKYAINPTTNEKIPIYVSNFAVMYGTGVVMCDAHDKRDFRFARKYNIPLKFVISKDGKSINPKDFEEAFVDNGLLFSSGKFSGMNNTEALPKMAEWLQKGKMGEITINYKIKDWMISRQRYWGTPIPIIYCDKCGVVPVSEKDLPVLLPKKVDFKAVGNPIATNAEFVNVKCPKCGGKGKRETDTMGGFMDSSWYFLRYCDNKNKKEAFDRKKVDYWMPVDQYIGGAEHAVMHLLYARFFTKFLKDIGMIGFDEPFSKLFNQGIVYKDGAKMSKSKGNVVFQTDISGKYGIDTARFFLMSVASPDKQMEWSDDGVMGSFRFINKVLKIIEGVKIGKSSDELENKVNSTIKNVGEYLDSFEYRKATIELRELIDLIYKNGEVSRVDLESALKLLSPFCPHITEEIWSKLGNKNYISLAEWPKYEEKKESKKQENISDRIVENIKPMIEKLEQSKKVSKIFIYVMPFEIKNIDVKKVEKSFGKPTQIFAVNDASKYDPENWASKAKPGKPGVFVE